MIGRIGVALVATACLGCGTERRALPACLDVRETPSARGDPVIVAAGDIAACGDLGPAEATARLLDRTSGIVVALGDVVSRMGTLDELLDCYGPTWGRHRARTRPAVGNHEYQTPHAGPYFAYFCGAGEPFRGWYSYDAGRWHVVVLNSNCDQVSCAGGSEQERWLRADLAAHPARCTLAYWHHPRFSSTDPNALSVLPFWMDLYEAGVDLVLAGHAHGYERFAPQDPYGNADPLRGAREIVVGTGGAEPQGFVTLAPNSEVRATGIHGVLALTLHPSGYDWEFLPAEGSSFTDRGEGECH